MDQQYFATLPLDSILSPLMQAEENYRQACRRKGLHKAWRLTYCQAFGFNPNTAAFTGLDVEGDNNGATALRFRTNLSKPNVRQSIIMALGERPAYQAIASNLDAKSEGQQVLVGKLIDYSMREAGLDEKLYSAVESDRYFGSGTIHVQWDLARGENIKAKAPKIDPETNKPLMFEDGTPVEVPVTRKSGGIKLSRCYPWQVVRNVNAEEDDWIIIKELVSKYELAAQWPELADQILAASPPSQERDIELLSYDYQSCSEDLVVLRHFYHRSCAAVEGGRYVQYLGNLPLFSRRCPVQDGLPVADVVSMRYFGSRLGHSEASDLVAQQEILDDLISSTVTNLIAYGNQDIFVPEGTDYEPGQGTNRVFKVKDSTQIPVTINWQKMPDAVKWVLEYISNNMQRVAGLNETAMGNPESANMSGVAIATLTQIAVKYQQNTQRAADECIVRVGNISLELMKANATDGLIAEIAGKSDTPLVKLFTQDDLQGFRRVQIIRTNPLLDTFAGRQALWTEIKNLPTDQKRAAVELFMTGSTDAIFESDYSQTGYIRQENEALMDGIAVTPAPDDDIDLHMKMHRAQRDKFRLQPQSPERDRMIQIFNQHILEHVKVWMKLDPTLAEAMKLPVPSVTKQLMGVQETAEQELEDKPQSSKSLPQEPKPADPQQEAAQPHANFPGN